MHRIAVLGYDGIGDEVLQSCISVISKVTEDLEFFEFEGGYDVYQEIGEPIKEEDVEEIKYMDAVLFGSTTTPFDEKGYKSLILTLRDELDLYANLRIIPGFWDQEDVYIVRENCEGLYSGEYEVLDDQVADKRVISEKGCERITEFAMNLAHNHGLDEITFVHKANVLRGDKFFRDIVRELGKEKGIEVDERLIDAFTIELVENFWEQEIILSENLFGDIISDLSSINVDSLGLIPSGNFGEDIALFEPVHGSAPDIAGRGIANPIGCILSGGMLLNHLGFEGDLIWEAVESQMKDGTLTPDLGGEASTEEVTQEIITRIDHLSSSNKKLKGGDKK